jgi:hypothetical protein
MFLYIITIYDLIIVFIRIRLRPLSMHNKRAKRVLFLFLGQYPQIVGVEEPHFSSIKSKATKRQR